MSGQVHVLQLFHGRGGELLDGQTFWQRMHPIRQLCQEGSIHFGKGTSPGCRLAAREEGAASRATLIGFVIGVSNVRMRWALHGAMMGVLVGLPFAVGCLLEPENVETAIAALILGAIYGFLIELLTSVVFGARQSRVEAAPA